MARKAAIDRALKFYDDGLFFKTLERRVAIRTESQVEQSRPFLRQYLDSELRPAFQKMGYTVEIFENPEINGVPFLLATRIENPKFPTVLSYGHGDVIKGLDDQWRKGFSPWILKEEGNKVYGRGTADNKSQHTINMAALAAVIEERGTLSFNSKFLIETGEEIGSPGLSEFCEKNKTILKADVFISSDGPRLEAKRPTLFLGARGSVNYNFTVNLRKGSHHSGNWGGLLTNPGVILAHALSSIISVKGQVLVKDLLPQSIPQSIRNALKSCDLDLTGEEPKIDQNWGEPGLTESEKVFAWNTFEILAFKTGNPENPVSAIPATATAHCQIRYVEGVDPDSFLPALKKHLAARGFNNVEVERLDNAFFTATRLDPDNPWVSWAARSLEETLKIKPAIIPNIGGSLPNECFSKTLSLPTIWVPHSYPGCSQHAPDEHVLKEIMREGLQIMTGLFWDLAESHP